MKCDYKAVFAENLKRLRKTNGWTQAELAEKIAYSEKSVSKWEKGEALPPVETLMHICEVMKIELCDLMDDHGSPKYFLGIDGGATKTTFVLADENGKILRSAKLTSCNPFDIGVDAAQAVLSEGILEVCRGISKNRISLYAGLSGGTSGAMKKVFSDFFATFGFGKYDNGSDANNILAAGLSGRNGVALIMGTGSSAFIMKDGTVYRAGGLGYLLDGGGSGYDIGKDAIRYACMQEDMTGEKTLIHDLLLEKTGFTNAIDNLSEYYSMGKAKIASFCPIVFEAYKAVDRIAESILLKNAERVAQLLKAAYKRLQTEQIEVVIVGGLSAEFDVLRPMIIKHLNAMKVPCSFDMRVYDGDVTKGALLLAGMKLTANSDGKPND